ncbi:hypothetical protein DNH61_11785 [Paenibacillus sambharensis]|uniref:Uncharacterized protein n=1 Tax=Paenibacillus sambharensis TaxID=1803190 RepID=A0A2W1LL61_9BACL|nr:hypothetical protein [Paenibacillus sambharensis]PZD95234.1 hypothetical protein DNH61_11785 [Paenibacillus sambharensis]
MPMKTYQFTVATRIDAPGTEWHNTLYVIPDMLTPRVKTDGPAEAMLSDEVVNFCELNKCTVYEQVRSWGG